MLRIIWRDMKLEPWLREKAMMKDTEAVTGLGQ